MDIQQNADGGQVESLGQSTSAEAASLRDESTTENTPKRTRRCVGLVLVLVVLTSTLVVRDSLLDSPVVSGNPNPNANNNLLSQGRRSHLNLGRRPARAVDRESFEPWQVVPRMPPITQVKVLPVNEVGEAVLPQETVLGVTIGDESRAYSINTLTGPRREIFNDRLTGRAIAATW